MSTKLSFPRKRESALIPAFAGMTAVFFLCGFKFDSAIKNERGNKYYQKGQLGKAKSAYESAFESDPASGAVAFNLGNAYYREESFDKSLEKYTAASANEKSPSLKARAYYNLGNAYVRKKQTDKAVESYKQALRLNPGDEDAKFNLELLEGQSSNSTQDKQTQTGQTGQEEMNQKGGQRQEDQESKPEGQQPEEQAGQNKDQEAGESQGEAKKTPAEIRADQILDALENQEKQVLRLSGQKNPVTRVRRVTDKDW